MKLAVTWSSKVQQEKSDSLEATISAFNSTLHEALGNIGGVGSPPQINSVAGDINQSVQESMSSHYAFADRAQMIAQPLDYNRIQRSYVEGPFSITKNLPRPGSAFYTTALTYLQVK